MKKILRFFRNLLVFAGWSVIFIAVTRWLTWILWRFDFTSTKSWHIFSDFWNKGGILNTTSDILLLFVLFTLPFLWFLGFFYAKKQNYIKIFLTPLTFVYNLFNRSSADSPERIVLKNLKSSDKIVDDIKNEIASIKPQKNVNADNIRLSVNQKLNTSPKK